VKRCKKPTITHISRSLHVYLPLADHVLVGWLTLARRAAVPTAHWAPHCNGRVRPSATRRTAAYVSAQDVLIALLVTEMFLLDKLSDRYYTKKLCWDKKMRRSVSTHSLDGVWKKSRKELLWYQFIHLQHISISC